MPLLNFFSSATTITRNGTELVIMFPLRTIKLPTLLKNHVVCNKHFKNHDYTMAISPFKTKLVKDAIPKNLGK